MCGNPLLQIAAQTVEGLWSQGVAEPGDLSLGQLAGGVDASIAQFAAWRLAVLHLPYLSVSDAAHGGEFGVQRILPAQFLDFAFQPRSEHGVEAVGDASMQDATVGRHEAYGCEAILRYRFLAAGNNCREPTA